MNIKIKAGVTIASLGLVLGTGAYVGQAGMNAASEALAHIPPHNAEMAHLRESERRLEIQFDADMAAIELEAANLQLISQKENAKRQRVLSDQEFRHTHTRNEQLAWVITSVYGTWYASFAVLPVAIGGLICWRVWRANRQEDEDRMTIDLAHGAIPVSREFILNNPHALHEFAAWRVRSEIEAKVIAAQPVSNPQLTTFTYSPTTTYAKPTAAALEAPAAAPAAVSDEMAQSIMEALAAQNIAIRATRDATGPQCLTYALKPTPTASGKKPTIASILARTDDVALALGIESIRGYLGAGAVMLEVPRPDREFVNLEDILNARAWVAAAKTHALPIALGKDSRGNVAISDLAAMPHLLVGGATGMGKSVILRSIILCLSQQENVRLTLLDPKRVEFAPFASLDCVSQVAKDADTIEAALTGMIAEMDRRAELFEAAKVPNIAAYNKRSGSLPYQIVIVDEMADLLMMSEDAEDLIVRLAQKARFAGIHLILATQRPDAKTISPLIRANVPARWAVRCAASGDSDVILGKGGGADKLLDKGDSIYFDAATSKCRIQSAYADLADGEKAEKRVKESGTKLVPPSTELIPPNEMLTDDSGTKLVPPSAELIPPSTNLIPPSAELTEDSGTKLVPPSAELTEEEEAARLASETDLSANAIFKQVGGSRTNVLAVVKRIRAANLASVSDAECSRLSSNSDSP